MDTREVRPEQYTSVSGAEQFKAKPFKSEEVKADAVKAAEELSSFPPRSAQIRVHRKSSYDRGVQIAAAKLRVATDRKLGETTPDWIKELAAEKPRSNAS